MSASDYRGEITLLAEKIVKMIIGSAVIRTCRLKMFSVFEIDFVWNNFVSSLLLSEYITEDRSPVKSDRLILRYSRNDFAVHPKSNGSTNLHQQATDIDSH